jgi:exosome complex exonuclease DIS3/RRP44
MISLKHVYRKTKKGSIIKIVNENYLRDDIGCGRQLCLQCDSMHEKLNQLNESGQLLDLVPDRDHSLVDSPHFLIPDASALCNQLDIIEDSQFGENLIILQSVLDEVRRKNLQLYLRVKQLISSKRCYLFINKFNRFVFSARKAGESETDYQDRLVRLTVVWYEQHLDGAAKCVYLTDQSSTKSFAAGQNLTCYLVSEYVAGLPNSVNLMDKLAQKSVEDLQPSANAGEDKFMYPEHLPLNQLHEGIRSGRFFQTKYQANPHNFLEGFAYIKQNDEDVMVLMRGKEHINRAIHDDQVAMELLPVEQWQTKSDLILDTEEAEEKMQLEELADEQSLLNDKRRVPSGRVVGILKRNWRQYCGVLKIRDEILTKSMVLTGHLFVPAEKRIPIVRVETRQYETLKSQRIIVAIDSWPRDSKYPKGHYVRALGEIGDKTTETEVVLLEHDVPYQEFTKAVINCLPDPTVWTIPDDEFKQRMDLRDRIVCSVDPPGCTDIDDALHYRLIDENTAEVGVHIADVSYFVRPNSPLDAEAANRGTTVYLVDRRIDMIPGVLSSNLCSLIEKKERLVFTVIWQVDVRTGDIISTKFTKGVIRSRGAFTYADAQLRIDNASLTDEITESLRGLNRLAQKLKQKRVAKGALVLANMGELKFVEVESETHDNMIEIETKQLRETNSMVEEFMLLANVSVAEKLYNDFPELALLRRHPKPSLSNFGELQESVKSLGFDLDLTSNKTFSSSLDKINAPDNPFLNLMIRMLATRCMSQAVYFCSGTLPNVDANFNHYGLALDLYTHFTSPIRRYADLVVHRLLAHAIGYEPLAASIVSKDKMNKTCENINYRHRKAQHASRASIKLYSVMYIKAAKHALIEDAYVLSVRKNAMTLLVTRLALEVVYFLNPETDWQAQEQAGSLTQRHIPSGHTFRLFDPVKVKLEVVDKSTSFKRGYEQIHTTILQPNLN